MDNETCNSLADVRAQIDRIDGQMVKLIAERSGYVSLAARFKSRREEVVDRERIEKVVAAARSLAAELGLEPDLVEQVFRAMIDRFVAFEFREFDRIHGAPAASGEAE